MLNTLLLITVLFVGACLSVDVITPFGVRPEECVLEVPSGATVTPFGSSVKIQYPETETTPSYFVLKEVPPHCGKDIEQIRERASRRFSEKIRGPDFNLNGWLDYGGWYPPNGQNNLKSFTSTYVVPNDPAIPNGGQVLFYFIGMQDNDAPNSVNILQPVLTWGNGYNQWYFQSWACCPSNITVNSPPVFGLRAGSTLYGVISRDSPSTWRIDSQFNGQHSTLNAQVGDFQYNWADVTLEVYKVTECGHFASGTAAFRSLNLQDAQGQSLNPQWQFTGPTVCSGNIRNDGAGTVTISHSN